jgi:hypothetical protein
MAKGSVPTIFTAAPTFGTDYDLFRAAKTLSRKLVGVLAGILVVSARSLIVLGSSRRISVTILLEGRSKLRAG